MTLCMACGLLGISSTWAVGLMLLGTGFKEFAIDTWQTFEGDSWGGSWLDFRFWCVGIGCGWGLHWMLSGGINS